MAKFRRIGVLTSGGDAPGMNATLRAVTNTALANGVEVMGIYGGYSGLINDNLVKLDGRNVANIISLSGTVIYSDRCLEFKTEEGMAKAIETCRKYNIDGIVAIGGDGTFRGATDLSARGIPTIGLPGTIDNDITSTDETIGYDTAKNTLLNILDNLRDTCESHARCDVVEAMGRNAGYIALECAAASAAVGVVLRECPFDEEALMNRIIKMRAEGQRSFIVVVAEGVENFAEGLTARIEEKTGVESRFCRPAHILRGGKPTLRDRALATEMGYYAVEKLLDGMSNVVVCKRHGEITTMNIQYALILDRMFKKKLKDGDLDAFSAEQVEEMKAVCAEKQKYFDEMYNMVNSLAI